VKIAISRLPAVLALSVSMAVCAVSPGHAGAAFKLKTLYSFCNDDSCTDGENPQGLLFNSSRDVIYGTTTFGGTHGGGTVFTLVRNKHGKWKHTKIYDFDCVGLCPGGWIPTSGKLIRDQAGNLYGTTQRGGIGDSGGGYELVKNGDTWTLKALYDNCAVDHCADGIGTTALTYAGASTGAPYDGTSPLYGSSRTDGILNEGVFFSLTLNNGTWTKNVLYTPHGASLGGSLITHDAETFFGIGSPMPSGPPFLFNLKQNGGHWGIGTLHNFTGGEDGANPMSPLLLDAAGNIFGATQLGGNSQIIGGGGGTLYQWNGSSFATIEKFCSLPNCKDGYFANGGPTQDMSGNLIGTVDGGGKFGSGAVYRYTGGTTSLLYSFCKKQSGGNCTDGSEPYGEVLADGSGNLFGMTYNNAVGPHGAIFELIPPAAPLGQSAITSATAKPS
jgi:hypothetical protein